jgi:hypothetical protein
MQYIDMVLWRDLTKDISLVIEPEPLEHLAKSYLNSVLIAIQNIYI